MQGCISKKKMTNKVWVVFDGYTDHDYVDGYIITVIPDSQYEQYRKNNPELHYFEFKV